MVFAVICLCWVLDAETLHNSLFDAHLALEDCCPGRAIIADPVVAVIEAPVPFFHRCRLVAFLRIRRIRKYPGVDMHCISMQFPESIAEVDAACSACLRS